MATALAQTITIVKGKKVVSTSKHFVGLYKEAKTAYLEKKAELKSAREEEFQQQLLAIRGADDLASQRGTPVQSRNVSRESSRNRGRVSPGIARSRTVEQGRSGNYFSYGDQQGQSAGSYVDEPYMHNETELARRYTSSDVMPPPYGTPTHRSAGGANLNYGANATPMPMRRTGDEDELRMKMTTLNRMLEEANCMQHSAKAIIKSLETNPDAMAAVALTLAEISNLARKMAPGALMSFKGAFPAVIALLASPEFLIAVGVGVGLTVVALGGYKIIKRIQAKKPNEGDVQTDELEEITGDLDSIEAWRRGISDDDVQSIGTSVEGEFITPRASQNLREQGILADRNTTSKKASKRIVMPANAEYAGNDTNNEQMQVKGKEKSGLRMLFKKSR